LESLSAPVERRGFLRPEQVRQLVRSCEKQDAAMFKITRDEHDGKRPPGTTVRYTPITALVRFLLLTGLRVSEAFEVEWRDVDGDVIRMRAAVAKTKQTRDVDLSVTATALPAQRGAPGDRIFDFTADEVRAAQRRTIEDLEAPELSPQALRRTCSTYFTYAFNAWRSAKSVGHSVPIAERHDVALVKMPIGVTTLEQAMGIGAE
jgi:integrase